MNRVEPSSPNLQLAVRWVVINEPRCLPEGEMIATPPGAAPRAAGLLLLREVAQRAVDHRFRRAIDDDGVDGGGRFLGSRRNGSQQRQCAGEQDGSGAKHERTMARRRGNEKAV